jgi:hypothetical protein
MRRTPVLVVPTLLCVPAAFVPEINFGTGWGIEVINHWEKKMKGKAAARKAADPI